MNLCLRCLPVTSFLEIRSRETPLAEVIPWPHFLGLQQRIPNKQFICFVGSDSVQLSI